jgi:hypothetical protein
MYAKVISNVAVWNRDKTAKVGQLPAGSVFSYTSRAGTWMQKPDGNWVNAGANWQYVTLISTTPPVTPPPPSPVTTPKHTIRINETGQVSVDGLPYE